MQPGRALQDETANKKPAALVTSNHVCSETKRDSSGADSTTSTGRLFTMLTHQKRSLIFHR